MYLKTTLLAACIASVISAPAYNPNQSYGGPTQTEAQWRSLLSSGYAPLDQGTENSLKLNTAHMDELARFLSAHQSGYQQDELAPLMARLETLPSAQLPGGIMSWSDAASAAASGDAHAAALGYAQQLVRDIQVARPGGYTDRLVNALPAMTSQVQEQVPVQTQMQEKLLSPLSALEQSESGYTDALAPVVPVVQQQTGYTDSLTPLSPVQEKAVYTDSLASSVQEKYTDTVSPISPVVQDKALYTDSLAPTAPVAQTGAGYTDALAPVAPVAKEKAVYTDSLAPALQEKYTDTVSPISPVVQEEALYTDSLAPTVAQTGAGYTDALAPVAPVVQEQVGYTDSLAPVAPVQENAGYTDGLAPVAPVVQEKAVYTDSLTPLAPVEQEKAGYTEQLLSTLSGHFDVPAVNEQTGYTNQLTPTVPKVAVDPGYTEQLLSTASGNQALPVTQDNSGYTQQLVSGLSGQHVEPVVVDNAGYVDQKAQQVLKPFVQDNAGYAEQSPVSGMPATVMAGFIDNSAKDLVQIVDPVLVDNTGYTDQLIANVAGIPDQQVIADNDGYTEQLVSSLTGQAPEQIVQTGAGYTDQLTPVVNKNTDYTNQVISTDGVLSPEKVTDKAYTDPLPAVIANKVVLPVGGNSYADKLVESIAEEKILEEAREEVTGYLGQQQEQLAQAQEQVNEYFDKEVKVAEDKVQEYAQVIATDPTLINKEYVSEKLDQAKEYVAETKEAALDSYADQVEQKLEALVDVTKPVVDSYADVVEKALDTTEKAVKSYSDVVDHSLDKMKNSVETYAETVDKSLDTYADVAEKVSDVKEQVIDTYADQVEKKLDTYSEVVDKAVETYADQVEKVTDSYVEQAKEVAEKYKDIATEQIEQKLDTYADVSEKITDTYKDVLDQVSEYADKVEDKLDTYKDTVEKVLDGASAVTETYVDTAKEALDTYADTAEKVVEVLQTGNKQSQMTYSSDDSSEQALLKVSSAETSPIVVPDIMKPDIGLCALCAERYGLGYAPVAGLCDAFLQCRFSGGKATSVQVKRCAPGTQWSQAKLICDFAANVGCVQDPLLSAPGPCPHRQATADANAYLQVTEGQWVQQACAAGMVYSEAECACVKPISFSVAAPECPDKRAAPGGYEQLVHGSWLPMPCPGGLVFNANTCVCDWPQADNQVEQVALDYTGDTPSCTLLPAPGKPAHYQEMIHGVLMTRPCGPGTTFDPVMCRCDTHAGPEPAPGLDATCKPTLRITFQGGIIRDESPNGFWVNNSGVAVQEGVGVFDGAARLTVPALANMDLGHTLCVLARYRPAAPAAALAHQTLASNGDCGEPEAVGVCTGSADVTFTAHTDGAPTPASLSVPKDATVDGWQVAKLVLTAGELSGFTGAHAAHAPAPGPLTRRHQGLVIGQGGPCQPFRGQMQEIAVYKCLPAL